MNLLKYSFLNKVGIIFPNEQTPIPNLPPMAQTPLLSCTCSVSSCHESSSFPWSLPLSISSNLCYLQFDCDTLAQMDFAPLQGQFFPVLILERQWCFDVFACSFLYTNPRNTLFWLLFSRLRAISFSSLFLYWLECSWPIDIFQHWKIFCFSDFTHYECVFIIFCCLHKFIFKDWFLLFCSVMS